MPIDGRYDVQLQTTLGNQAMSLTLQSEGESLSGKISGFFGEQAFTEGKVTDTEFSWTVGLESPIGVMKLDVKGTYGGDAIQGEVQLGSFRPTPFTGKRL